jgi:hypothetical protein
VAFYLVYVSEAHPVKEGTKGDGAQRSPKQIGRAERLQDRAQAAVDCLRDTGLTMPVLLDRMDGGVEKAYRVRKAGTAVIDVDGQIRFHASGPGGAQPKEAEKALKAILPEATQPAAKPPGGKLVHGE